MKPKVFVNVIIYLITLLDLKYHSRYHDFLKEKEDWNQNQWQTANNLVWNFVWLLLWCNQQLQVKSTTYNNQKTGKLFQIN